MNHKQWIKISFTITFVIIFSIITIFATVNPYKLFDNSITQKKFFYTKYYSIKLFNMLKEKEYSLVFGTSRSQRIQSDNSEVPLLNFSSSLYGNSLSVLNFLQQLDKKQLSNVNKIYYLVDDHCLNGSSNSDSFSKYYNIDFSKYYLNYALENLFYINVQKLIALYNDIDWNIHKNYQYYLQENGSMVRLNKNESFGVPDNYTSKATPQYFQQDGIDALIAINNFCIKNNIQIAYYTPTHYEKYTKLMDTKIMKEKWSKLLDGGIKGFYALWYVDNISNLIQDNKYIAFSDRTSHLNENYLHQVFINNVVKQKNKYFISSKEQLKEYLQKNQNYFD